MIVLSMLGTNDYMDVVYAWGDLKAQSSKFFQAALTEWFPQADLLICVTPEAREKHGSVVGQLLPNVRLIDIPSGKNEAEYWEIFSTVERHIPEGAELVFDMTHGFRSLPTLTLLAVSFLRVAKSVQIKHVLYGAFEARVGDVAPVFDLTPFVGMLDWANSTSRFVETGDGRRFKELLAHSESSSLKGLGSELEKFTNAMVLNRTTEATDSAKELLRVVQSLRHQPYAPGYQQLRLLESKLQKAVEQIADQDPIRSQFAQILRYSQQQQYAQSIALAREWMISVRIWKTDGWFSENKEERQLAEEWLTTFAKVLEHKSEVEKEAEKVGDTERQEREKQKRLSKIPPQWVEFIRLWQKVSDQRNDYAHFGMRKQKSSTETTLKKAKSLPHDLRQSVLTLGLELPEVSL